MIIKYDCSNIGHKNMGKTTLAKSISIALSVGGGSSDIDGWTDRITHGHGDG